MATCKYCGKWFDDDRGYHPSIGNLIGRIFLSSFTPAVQKVAYCSRRCYERYDSEYSKKSNNSEVNKNKISDKSKVEAKNNSKVSSNNDIDYRDIIFRLKNLFEDIYDQYDTIEKAINIKKIIDTMHTGNITSSCFDTFEDKEYYGKFVKSLNKEYERLSEMFDIEN